MSQLPNLIPLSRPGDLPCPSCAKLMQPYRCDNVVVDMCRGCNGIWFDRKEIAVFRNALARFDFSKLMIEPNATPALNAIQLFECPRCTEPLTEGTYGYNSGVHVHQCTRCKGLWTPVEEVVGLIALAKHGQELGPELRGYLKEMKALKAENERLSLIARAVRVLSRVLIGRWYW